MNQFLAILLAACLILSPSAVLAGQDEQQRLDQWMEQTMVDYGIPGMALVVTRGDRIVYARGMGQGEPGRSFTVNTQVPLGELSQTLTALAVVRLVENGQVNLDDPIRKHIPFFRTADPVHSEALTVEDLLTHRSGMDARGYQPGLDPDRSISAGVVDLRRMKPQKDPGEQFRMFSPNYNVLGLLLEALGDEPFETTLRKEVLAPLGMSGTLGETGGDSPRLTDGHGSMFVRPFVRETSFTRYNVPSTGLVSSASDLGRFLLFLHSGVTAGLPDPDDEQEPEPAVLLSDTGRQGLWEPLTGRNRDFGLGWYSREDADGVLRVFRSGDTENHHAQMVFLPDEEVGVAIVANVNHVVHRTLVYPRMANQVLDLMEEDSGPGRPWAGYAHRGLLYLGIVLALGQVYRMRKVPATVVPFRYRGRGRLVLSILRDLAVPVVLLGVLPRVVRFALQLDLTTADYLQAAPDLVLVLVVLSVLPVLKVLLKVAVVMYRPRNPYRVNR